MFLKGLLFVGIAAVAWIIGVFGWAQIIGSIRQFIPARLFTIIVWIVILAAGWFLCRRLKNDMIVAVYIGYGISLIQILAQKRIE